MSEEIHRKLSENAHRRHAAMDGIGFQTRTKFKPSWPERLAMSELKKLGIAYQREVKIGRWFADFVVGKLVIEVDGQQHLKPERLAVDRQKDEYFKSLGYSVARFPWTGDKAEFLKTFGSVAQLV